jgi:hypothetical protein
LHQIPRVPAVAVSEYEADDDCARGVEFAAHPLKPVLAETMVSVVADIVAR